MENRNNFNGIINIYKEKGYTSFDVVAKLRGILKIKKIGHTGTLDPDAEGVLPVCVGKATKLCDVITDKNKTYEAWFKLGFETDTQDISGNVINRSETEKSSPTDDEITDAIKSFKGEYDQVPPMYSALKINGKRLYELAREGKTVERRARRINIIDIEILKIKHIENNFPEINIRVKCSKGTYIRTLCKDIGDKLGTYATMTKLLRTQSGNFTIDNTYTIDKVKDYFENDKNGFFENVLLPVDYPLEKYPKIMLGKEYEKYIVNGNKIQFEGQYEITDSTDSTDSTESTKSTESMVQDDMINLHGQIEKRKPEEGELFRIYLDNEFKALYKYVGNNVFKPEKMFL